LLRKALLMTYSYFLRAQQDVIQHAKHISVDNVETNKPP